jgi:putative transposase
VDDGESDFVFEQAYSHLKGAKADEPWLHAVPPQILRNDHTHQVSRVIADSHGELIAFERINLRNMTRRPKPVGGPSPGAFAPNRAAAKAGLNKSLLNAALGKIITYTGYKAARRGKIVVQVPAANASRECSRCHHTSADNRQTQAQFHCMACGHTVHADANASVIVAQRNGRLLYFFPCWDAARRPPPRRRPKRSVSHRPCFVPLSIRVSIPVMEAPTSPPNGGTVGVVHAL